jgi:hypothetical protein
MGWLVCCRIVPTSTCLASKLLAWHDNAKRVTTRTILIKVVVIYSMAAVPLCSVQDMLVGSTELQDLPEAVKGAAHLQEAACGTARAGGSRAGAIVIQHGTVFSSCSSVVIAAECVLFWVLE